MARQSFFYGWVVAAVCFITYALSIGPRQSFSVFLLPLHEDFGRSRSIIAGAFSLHMACYAVGGWALGILLDRVGARRVIIWSTVCWTLILLSVSRVASLWQFYLLFGVAGGTAAGGFSYVPNNVILARWFVRYRGLAIGLLQAGVPLGAAVFGPLAQLGIGRVGWRNTYALFGVLVGATAAPLAAAVLRNDPSEVGLLPDGGSVPSGGQPRLAGAAPIGFTGAGVPSGYWTIFHANVLRGMIMYALLVHQVAYLVDAGLSRMTAASYFSASFFVAAAGGLVAGGISDRVGRVPTYVGVIGLYVAGYASLLLVKSPTQVGLLVLFVLTSGVAYGGASAVFGSFVTDRLQGPRMGHLLGLQNIGFGIGTMLGPYLAGAAFDRLGSYTPAFLLMILCALGSGLLLAWVRQAPPTRR